jgi:LacI family transcriptional regulator
MADGRGDRRARVTIKAVAADAGVSVAAVSKVLRNAYGVSENLRAAVHASIEKLGYRPNVMARGMRGQTYTLGILLNDFVNPFLGDIVDGVNAVIQPRGYKLLIGVTDEQEPVTDGLIESMIDHRMDGLVFVAPQMTSASLSVYSSQVPFVCIALHDPAVTAFDTVNSDDFEGARLVVHAFREKGYEDIAMLSLRDAGVTPTSVPVMRERGYLAAMAEAGLSHRARILHHGSAVRPDGADFAPLLAAPDRPRAIFCWSDLHAVPLLNQAAAAGIRVPEDIAIAGYDNSRVAALPLINLTSVDQNGRGIGDAAARLLLSRIEGRSEPCHEVLAPHLVRRTSS